MNVAVVGVGLIGGSIGAGLLESGFAESVCGIDIDPANLEIARNRKLVTYTQSDFSGLTNIDLWVVATPPSAVGAVLEQIALVAEPETAITDCASVKQSIVHEVPASIKPLFVGGHPMGGTQHQGAEHASSTMFADRPWILTPNGCTEPRAFQRVQKMVFALDAVPTEMSPEEHDRHMAVLSHVPNILSSTLAVLGGSLERTDIAGGSWTDLTRLGGSAPELWADIISHNSSEIVSALTMLIERLDELREAVKGGDQAAVQRAFESARVIKDSQN